MRTPTIVAAVAAMSLILAACGSDEPEPETAAPPAENGVVEPEPEPEPEPAEPETEPDEASAAEPLPLRFEVLEGVHWDGDRSDGATCQVGSYIATPGTSSSDVVVTFTDGTGDVVHREMLELRATENLEPDADPFVCEAQMELPGDLVEEELTTTFGDVEVLDGIAGDAGFAYGELLTDEQYAPDTILVRVSSRLADGASRVTLWATPDQLLYDLQWAS